MNGSTGQFPYAFFLDRQVYSDPHDVTLATTHFVNQAEVQGVPPGSPIDLVGSALLFPSLSIWLSHFRLAAELRPFGVQAQQYIIFPGRGRLVVETRQEQLECDDRFGVNLETEDIVAARPSPGREGVGLSADRLTLVRRLAVLMDAPVRRRLVFDSRFDATLGHQSAVGDMIRSVLTPSLGSALTASPAMASALSATIFDLVLHSLPHNYSEDLHRPPVRIAPKHIKRAIDYVENNVHSGLTVDDLALSCGVSIRALQYGFRHSLDISPADHIRNVRLERARREILESGEASLTEIATRWGFANLARFNARFRVAYGETPSEYRRRQDEPRRR